jgi:hypothetical protein
MGNLSSKDSETTINWNKIKTDNVSSSIPNLNGLSKDAQTLIASLNIPQITESQTSEFTVNHILDKISTNLNENDQKKFNQLLDQVSSQSASEAELSATSPFISSEMYNYLVKNENKNQNQKGGKITRKIKSKKGGSKLDDDSSTSSTSSDSSMEDLLDSNEDDIKKNKKDKKNKKNKSKDSDTELSGGELSYLSSSAHTEGEYSDSHKSKSSSESSTTQKSIESSSVTQSSNKQSTVTDHNTMQSTSISVNTEDINMVSDY